MLIHGVARQLATSSEYAQVSRELAVGHDSTMSVAQSARPLLLASLWSENPRPCIYIVSGEEAADRAAHALAGWHGLERVMRYPARRDWPWSETAPDEAVIGARTKAISRLATGEPCIVVASARALMRMVPPSGSGYWASSTFTVGEEIPFEE
ncbi:MAG: transcription-repair coupling factor, partial [Atopobiaceae bacterium]|nr:transcription-repair coupling factor [Atopobiaceae bacterium]